MVCSTFFRFTSSSFVCWQGKEKVNPTGSFLSLMLCFSMKSPRHSATWSNSWSDREGEGNREAEGEGERKREGEVEREREFLKLTT